MAKITYQQADAMSPNFNNWFKLPQDGDTALIQFPYKSIDDIVILSTHTVQIDLPNGKTFNYKVDCLREEGASIEDCPLCDSGYVCAPARVLQFYNHKTGRVECWERSASFVKRVVTLMDTYADQDFPYCVFQVQRIGLPQDKQTKYELNFMPKADPIDWNDVELPDVLGTAIWSKTAEEMEDFLATGEFPREESAAPVREDRRPARTQERPQTRRPAPEKAAPPAASSRRVTTATSNARGASRGSARGARSAEEQF